MGTTEWKDELARTVGRRVAHYRRERGLSAEALSAELRTSLGIDMKRTVIGGLETGTRRNVRVDEIYALAYVLDVPPAELMLPLDEDEVEIVPGVTTHPWFACRWLDGLGGLPGEATDPGWHLAPRGAMSLYRRHDDVVANWLRTRRYLDHAKEPVTSISGVPTGGGGEEGASRPP